MADMREVILASLVIAVVLALPILPLLILGEGFEQEVASRFEQTVEPGPFAGLVVGILAADVLVPVPSSFVSTLAGARLGIAAATVASWLGMTLGACAGFGLARLGGRPLLARLVRADDVARLEHLGARLGPTVLVVTRAVPVLAEASVFFLGATRLSWARFVGPVALANLGIALVYSVVGQVAWQQAAIVPALVASVVLPVAATWLARRWLPRAVGER